MIDFRYQTQLCLGLFEVEISSWVQRLSRDINTAIDVGAGNGEYTIFFLANTNAKKVFSFDPQIKSRTSTYENLKLNNLDQSERLNFKQLYVGNKDGNMMCTLDSITKEITEPCLIKIDIEGNEADALKGANRLLDLKRCNWIIETHSKKIEEGCIEIFKKHQYKHVVVPMAWWRIILPEQRPTEQNRWLVAYR